MGTFLFKVVDRFVISQRGLILTSGADEKNFSIKSGDRIRLVRPDKTELITTIIGIAANKDMMVPLTISKDDIPIGTEVWAM